MASVSNASPIADSLKNDLVSLAPSAKRTKRFDDALLANTKYFAIYYSASWCAPCRAFTPKLVEWYNAKKAEHPTFELIFVSSDNAEAEMDAYMVTDKMPWPALKFIKKASNKSITHYAGESIPCLVFIDASGKVLSDSYVNGAYVGPEKVLGDIQKTLAATPATTLAVGATATPVATVGIKAKSAQGSNFDEFFKKKTPQ